MKVLLISLAARGHAIADALSRSRHQPEIVSLCPSRNPGIAKLADRVHTVDLMNFPEVLAIAKKESPDFAIVAPDDPIGAGLTDALQSIGIQSVSPREKLARIESSKAFARDLLQKYRIDASPQFSVFTVENSNSLSTFFDQLGGEFVVKYDALKGGKGVKISGDHLASTSDGIAYAQECIEECGRVVVEEKLIGPEFSLMSFVSGKSVVHMPAVQDHKRAYEGDVGPNTGGMGTYSDADHSLPFLQSSDISRAQELNRLTAEALLCDCDEPFIGILYGGFIVTANGIRLIEYNARFGDPEALNVLPLLSSDFVEICQAMINGELNDDLVKFEKRATVCKYITPDTYPESKDCKGEVVTLPEPGSDVKVFFGDIRTGDDGLLHLGGSRTAGVVGMGSTIAEAEQLAQKYCESVTGPVRFRSDVGTHDLIQKRIDFVNNFV